MSERYLERLRHLTDAEVEERLRLATAEVPRKAKRARRQNPDDMEDPPSMTPLAPGCGR